MGLRKMSIGRLVATIGPLAVVQFGPQAGWSLQNDRYRRLMRRLLEG